MASHHPHSRIPSASNNPAAASNAASSSGATATDAGASTTSQHGMARSSVRRNLFHHHLSRRPASGTTAPPTANNESNGSTSGGIPKAAPTTAISLSTASSFDNGDIVARDKNGGYKVDVPTLPPGMFGEGADDSVGDGMEGIEVGAGVGDEEMSGREKERIEASIVELMCRNRSRQINSEPSEILLLIQQSLRNKVATLEEDKWMYEVEEEISV